LPPPYPPLTHTLNYKETMNLSHKALTQLLTLVESHKELELNRLELEILMAIDEAEEEESVYQCICLDTVIWHKSKQQLVSYLKRKGIFADEDLFEYGVINEYEDRYTHAVG
jgi:hypothetical protein